MNDLPTPVGGDHPEQDLTIRHGEPRFDAVGLFIQWLVEHVSEAVGGKATIAIELQVGYVGSGRVKLLIVGTDRPFQKTWTVEHLNELQLADNGRGGLLKEEVRAVLAQLQEQHV